MPLTLQLTNDLNAKLSEKRRTGEFKLARPDSTRQTFGIIT